MKFSNTQIHFSTQLSDSPNSEPKVHNIMPSGINFMHTQS